MIDERALQAAIPVGSNMANAELVRAIIEAYEAARSAEPVAWRWREKDRPSPWRIEIGRPPSLLMPGLYEIEPLYTHPGAPNV